MAWHTLRNGKMALEISGNIRPGAGVNSTSEKVYNSISISRNIEIAKASGPLDQGKDIASAAAVIKGQPRGILKKLNLGDVDTPVDSVERAVTTAGRKTKAATREQQREISQPVKAENLKTALSQTGGNVSTVG
jgi:hypothetical protein